MLLKRSIILAAGVLLFIAAFIIYFDVSKMQMEAAFKAERVKYGVEGVTLTSATPATPPAPAADSNPSTPAAPSASSTPDGSSTPAAPATPDANSAPAPATPASPDTNAAPAAPPSSTMDDPATRRSSVFQLASYRPSEAAQIQLVDMATGQITNTTPAPASNSSPAAAQPNLSNALPPTTVSGTAAAAAPTATAPPAAHPVGGEGKVIVFLWHQFKAPGVKIPPMFRWTMNQDVFESEIKYIHDNGYKVIPMSDLVKFLKHEITLPSNCVCLTIDDGYKSAIVYAAPVLKKYGYPWTFFIYPDFITTGEGPGAASWNDLLELQKEGVDIESHSMTHPNLKLHKQKVKGVWHNFTPDEYAAWLNNETSGSKAELEQKMGKTITCFAYPYGEYNTQVENAAIAAGYEAIFTVADNPVHSTTSLHSIGRYTMTTDVLKNFAAYLRQGALGLDAADPAPGTTTSNPRPVITATLGYAGTLDPKSIETQVRDFGDVRHDFDPQTNTLRLYLPRDLIAPVVLVNIRVKDASTGQYMVANWHFNYEPGPNAVHPPIAPATKSPSAAPKTQAATPTTTASVTTPAPAATDPEPTEKNAVGSPIDTRPAPASTPAPATAPAAPVSSTPNRD